MMHLSTAARMTDGSLQGADVEFSAVGTDTRKLRAGELFVALVGPNFNGHDFLREAEQCGAAGALVSETRETSLPTLMVDDTLVALGRLGAGWRQEFSIPVIGVTGSNGKTTVKDMMAAILAQSGPVLATQGNLNNNIGVPLTLLRLRAHDRFAVIEMGMNHAGEIDYLTRLARPTVALITNAGTAHIGNLGSVEAIAHAKGEIFAGLDEHGIAIINADDDYAALWRRLAQGRRQISFGLRKPADVSARYDLSATGSQIHLQTPWGEIDMRLPLLGEHSVMNAVSAAAATLAAGTRLEDVKAGLEKMRAAAGRLELKTGHAGARVLDDTYNANPSSVAVGLEVLSGTRGERVLVLGDMGELGPQAADLHRRVGEMARKVGVEQLFGLGELSRHAVEGFGSGAQHFTEVEALGAALKKCMHADMTVLVKGSRAMRMERVVNAISAAPVKEKA